MLSLQARMIYQPRRYTPDDFRDLREDAVELTYRTRQGRMVAWYITPVEGGQPARIWSVFNGNAGTALNWRRFAQNYPGKDTGFLLVDYPAYGKCEGSPSPKSIHENANTATETLRKHLGISATDIQKRLGAFGHSLGAAVALRYACEWNCRRAVLISPFTSLRSMARIVAGWPLCWLLTHNWDNQVRLDELMARTPPPKITIFHGDRDEVVPFRMGLSLARRHPDHITFHQVKHGDHCGILETEARRIYQAMRES